MSRPNPGRSRGPTLETPRLILRPPVIEDMDAFAAFCADPEVMRYTGGVRTRADVFAIYRRITQGWAKDGFHMFSVLHKASGEWMGRVGPAQPKGWPGPEVGWGLAARWWHKGYASEAAAACMDFVFDSLGWDEVIHTIHPDHAASQSVARKLGSACREISTDLPPPYDGPHEIWGQTREAWRESRQRLERHP